MFANERQHEIVALLEKQRRLTNAELQRTLGVSPATLRRDLSELEAARRVVRFHGGVAHPSYLASEPSHEEKTAAAREEKLAIAHAVAPLVPEGATVLLDAGTTCLEVGRLLLSRGDLTLVVNSIAFANLARHASARVVCLGGEVRGVTGALVGSLALAWLERLSADLAILGASGLDAEGPSTTELSESEIKGALVARARRRILVADASKWDRPSLVRFARWPDLETWATAGALPRGAAATVAQQGTRVLQAGKSSSAAERTTERKRP